MMKKKWFSPKVKTGWDKKDSQSTRRWHVIRAHKGNYLAAARGLMSLANVTQDSETRRKALNDANYFFIKHRKSKKG